MKPKESVSISTPLEGYDMSQVVIRCPTSGREVATGISMDEASFESSTLENNVLGNCPACGGDHVWSKEDAFLKEQ